MLCIELKIHRNLQSNGIQQRIIKDVRVEVYSEDANGTCLLLGFVFKKKKKVLGWCLVSSILTTFKSKFRILRIQSHETNEMYV